jgi:hypothetical protein
MPRERTKGDVGEFVPARTRPRSNAWTLLLILAFIFFVATIYLAGKELSEFYNIRIPFIK